MIKPTHQLVSVDSSIWVDFFRDKTEKKYPQLRELIEQNLVAVCEPVITEILKGTKTSKQYQYYEFLMRANVILESPDGIWEKISQAHFELSRKGYQVHYFDLWIAYSAYWAKTYLWTLDKDFEIIQKVIPFKFYQGEN